MAVLKVPVFHKVRREDTSLGFQRSDQLQNLDYLSRIGIFSISAWLVVARTTKTSSVTGDLRPGTGSRRFSLVPLPLLQTRKPQLANGSQTQFFLSWLRDSGLAANAGLEGRQGRWVVNNRRS